jgi:hypothetical protein
MLKKLKAELEELLKLEERGVEERSDYAGQPSRSERIDDLRGRIAAYQRLADLANQGRKVAKSNSVA